MPEEQWSESERWAWQEIRAGRIADFNARDGNELDPKTRGGWTEERRLRSEFVKEILFREPFRSAIPVEGVNILGVWFSERMDLVHGRLSHQLSLGKCRFERAVELTSLYLDGWLYFVGSTFADERRISLNLSAAEIDGRIDMSGATVAGMLKMNGLEVGHLLAPNANFQNVDLTGAKIGGQFSLIGAIVAGTLTMGNLEVGQSLLMRGPNASFRNVDLHGAKVGDQLDMTGAAVAGTLTMNDLEVGRSLLMGGPNANFQSIDLGGAKVGGKLSMIGATVAGTLSMVDLEIGQSVLMRGPNANFRDVDLGNSKVGGQIQMDGATVAGTLKLNGLEVRHLLMRGPNANFQDVNLGSAKVGGQLSLVGATVAGTLTLVDLEVGQSLLMRGPNANFRRVDLGRAKVGYQLDLTGTTVAETLSMDSLEVGSHLFLRGVTAGNRIDLFFGRIGANLDLSGADFSGADFTEFDLSATRIEGELRLGRGDRPPPKWRHGARLTLRNTHAGVVQDRSNDETDAWPTELQLDGFTYGRMGGFHGADANMLARDIGRYIRWLARDSSYTPQPYEQLAGVFREAGEPTKANCILYESRKRARTEAWRQGAYFRWLGSSFLKWTIGYGLGGRYFLALGWVVAFTVIGTGVLYCLGQPSEGLAPGLPARVVYSLDQLLPIVEFEKYDKVALTGWAAYYFYVQKLLGWLLGSFLVAGLAGLTQK